MEAWHGADAGLMATAETRVERRDAAEHRRQILEAAQLLFAELGVTAVSMHQIAQAAGVGQGTLYRRYAHKGELCMDLLRESGERFWDEPWAFTSRQSGTALERLDGLIEHLIDFIEEKGTLLGVISEACAAHECGEQFRAPFYQRVHATVTALLDEAVESRELPALDVAYTADALLAALNPNLYMFQRQERGFTPAQILQGMRRIYIQGLASHSE